jgi:metallo-beta-lactamase family protein
MIVRFHGAAGVVTGSMHEIEAAGAKYLLDCGMFQGRRREAEQRNRNFSIDAKAIEAVVLSHAHIDHSGRLPLLVKNGFRGPVYATPSTVDLCDAMLRDTAHIAESDAAFIAEHLRGQAEPVQPLYTAEDVENTLPLFRPTPYHTPTEIGSGLTIESYDAGHILGSASILISEGDLRVAFSGDVGRPGLPIIRDPEPLPPVDYLIMESTYGGRKHPQQQEAVNKLRTVVGETFARGGRLMVPAFAVGRVQQLVLILHTLIDRKMIDSAPVFVDSPLAVNVTEVFRRHPECFDEEVNRFIESGEDPFGFNRLIYIRDAAESKRLNDLRGPFVVISPSGMCEAGRILHHLRHGIGDPRNTVLLTGYQAENTLGRKLEEGAKNVRIFGIPTDVRARIERLDELSGHADHEELLEWMRPMTPRLRRVFLVHGEPDASAALAKAIQEKYGIEAAPALPDQSFDLSVNGLRAG